MGAALALLLLRRVYGWLSILDWATVAVPTIIGIAVGVFPVKSTTLWHRVIFIMGGALLSGLIWLDQSENRKAHSAEMANLATKGDIAKLPDAIVLRLSKQDTKEVREEAPLTPAASPPRQDRAKETAPNTVPESPSDIDRRLDELKHLITGQRWGLSGEQLAALSRSMAAYAPNREAPELITCVLGDPDSARFATNLVEAFRYAGWKLPGSGFSQAVFMGPVAGIVIKLHSREDQPPGLLEFVRSMRGAGIEPVGEIDEKVPIGDFRIIVGNRPA
jgi:hypothetical protein